jgi:peroxiredoxin
VKSERSFAGPFIALFVAMIVGWLMMPGDAGAMRLPVRPAPAPDWALPDLQGRTNSLGDFAGKVVVLNFWATFCPPCIREVPALMAFHRRGETNGVVVIGIACDPDAREVVPDFVRRNGINYPVLYADTKVVEDYGSITLPQTFIIDRNGRIAARFLGRMREKELDAAVAPLLAGGRTNALSEPNPAVR